MEEHEIHYEPALKTRSEDRETSYIKYVFLVFVTIKCDGRVADLTGRNVSHNKYGNGTVTNQKGTRLYVSFEDGEKTFILPDAVANGFLGLDDASIIDDTKRLFEVHTKMKDIEKQIRFVELQIGMLEREV